VGDNSCDFTISIISGYKQLMSILSNSVKGRPLMGLSGAGVLSPKSQISFGADPEGPAEVVGVAEAAGTVGMTEATGAVGMTEATGAVGVRTVMISWVGSDSSSEDSVVDNLVPESPDSALGLGVASW
jgi:hypothetical protein